jgi:beta-galactosidase
MFNFGVDYYPEQWPRERWAIDAQLMAETGFNVVRLAEFAWVKMEPADGQFDFTWLDDAIAILSAQGLRVILGTPTASPPAWLMSHSPDLYRVREDGVRVTYGNRREYCPNHPGYLQYSRRITAEMATHYAQNPAVIGWQTDNEFGDRCYCSVCIQAFQSWLQHHYESLDALNEQWGTIFWSHTYTAWSQIPGPLSTGHSPNPGLALDYYRFCSDSYVEFQQLQIEILRKECPTQFITHNLMGFGYDKINYFDLAQPLDFVSWDNYPRHQWSFQTKVDPASAALSSDTMRGLKRKNFWVMEQQGGPGGWELVSVAPRPGELRLWAYQSIAHGADAIIFFRWRTARYGTEQYWHGLLDHDATPGRRYQEIKQMGHELKTVGTEILGATVKADVALVLSYDSRFAFQIQPNNPQLGYPAHLTQIYRAIYECHVSVDVLAPTDDLSAYKLIIAPMLHIVTPEIAANLSRFVENGGTLVCDIRSGVKDKANAIVNLRLPGLLKEIMGVEVEDYASLTADMAQPLQFCIPALEGKSANTSAWCDILKPTGSEIVASYSDDYYAGKPAITLNHYGKGQAVYVGTAGDEALYPALMPWLLKAAQIDRPVNQSATQGIEIAVRWQGDRRFVFVLNHTDQVQVVTLDSPMKDLLSGAQIEGQIQIQPKEVYLLSE